MAYTEDDILYEIDVFAVIREDGAHKVLVSDITHAIQVGSFAGTADGLSCATAWVDYMVKHYSVEAIAKLAGTYSSTILALRRSRERHQANIESMRYGPVEAVHC